MAANGWRTHSKKSVANRDLWDRLITQHLFHHINWNRVPGHHPNYPLNERCDRLAVAQKRLFQSEAAA